MKSILLKSYEYSNKDIENNSYIQVLNLMYICDKDLKQAINKHKKHSSVVFCDTEKKSFPFIWYVWGGSNVGINKYKDRFSQLNRSEHFYFDNKSKIIVESFPSSQDSARHTQGLSHDFVVPYISTIV